MYLLSRLKPMLLTPVEVYEMLSKENESQIVLANAAQLALGIISETLGNDAADTIEGVKLKNDVILSMIEARLQSNLARFAGI